jgi:hypothetical protein
MALASGNIAKNQWLNEPVPVLSPGQTADIKQKELIKRIHFEALKSLKELLQDDIYLYGIEYPCPPYGFVDMVYRSKNTVYPIEVKKDQGKHDLIGQVCKYDLFHRLKLHQKHYEFVKSVTICQSYQTHVLREIKQLNILPVCYNMENKGISLKSP